MATLDLTLEWLCALGNTPHPWFLYFIKPTREILLERSWASHLVIRAALIYSTISPPAWLSLCKDLALLMMRIALRQSLGVVCSSQCSMMFQESRLLLCSCWPSPWHQFARLLMCLGSNFRLACWRMTHSIVWCSSSCWRWIVVPIYHSLMAVITVTRIAYWHKDVFDWLL